MTEQTDNRVEYRRAWSRFVTGVTIITSTEPGGATHGMTANGVTSVSLDPPLALVCVAHSRNSYSLIKESGRFGISVLSQSQKSVAQHFAKDPAERGSTPDGMFEELGAGPAVVSGSLSIFSCEVVAHHVEGDHSIFIGLVKEFETRDGEPLIWYEAGFPVLESQD